MTGGAAGRVLRGGQDRGSGFAITQDRALTAGHVVWDPATMAGGPDGGAAGPPGPVLVYVVDREPTQVPVVVAYQPEDGEPITVTRIEVSTALDVAVLYLQRPAPASLPAAGGVAADEPWRVETRPGRRDSYTLNGTVTDPRRRMWNEGGKETTLIQLLVVQQVGDYKGYSGSPVIAAPAGGVLGVLVEQGRWRTSSQLGQPPPVANVLFAAPIDQVRSEFGLEGVAAARSARPIAGLAGWPLDEVSDPFALEVHRSIQPDSPQPGLPELPAYVPREHDREVARAVDAAAAGRSQVVVLVGGSSTGKTRACWEALRPLRDQTTEWRLWHPIDPTRPDAALAELRDIGPQTVVWLNEAQFYLDVADGGLGERVAAGLRALLRDPGQAPVLVLATLWPEYWDALTARPVGGADPHAQARELLAGHDIAVPAAFTAAQLQQLREAADVRLTQAAAVAQDGQVIQFLAGVPELLARYRNAPPAAAAVIRTAMDARRLGMRPAVPHAFLEAAAPGYLTDAEWDALDENWLEQALDYTGTRAKGIRGPLTRHRPRPAVTAGHRAGPVYLLADYLDQHGRATRRDRIPPPAFWTAAASHADPGDLEALGFAAENRGLLRVAAQLYKQATDHGDAAAAVRLVEVLHGVRPADPRPAHWAATHARLDDFFAVRSLLEELWKVGAGEQAGVLAARSVAVAALDDPADVARLLEVLWKVGAGEQAGVLAARAVAVAALDDPDRLTWLLGVLRQVGAGDQVGVLVARGPGATASLDEPSFVGRLLSALRKAGAGDQVAVLAARAATDAPVHDPRDAADLLSTLRVVGAGDQVAVLAARAATGAALDNPGFVAHLLDALREAGANKHVGVLLARDPATHAAIDNAHAVIDLLRALRDAGAGEQAGMLADRAATGTSLDDPLNSAVLLSALRDAGAGEQARVLAVRAATGTPLDNPEAVAALLDVLREVGAGEQAGVLAARAATSAPLDNPRVVELLLGALGEAGADEQVAVLAARAASGTPLDDPTGVAGLLGALREAGADEQVAVLVDRAASGTPLDDPTGVAGLLGALREAGADEQVAVLVDRAATSAPLDSPWGVADLLRALREARADEQVGVLADRAATSAPLDSPWGVADLLRALREARADEQVGVLADRAATSAPVDNPRVVEGLLGALREAGAEDKAEVLIDRMPGAAMFHEFSQEGRKARFRFGRENDGSPAEPWGWENLD